MSRQVDTDSEETSWWEKLKRRKVISTTILYTVPVGVILSNTPDLLSYFQVSPVLGRIIIYAAVASIPIVALLAWLYEVTPRGIIRDRQDTEEDLTVASTFLPAKYPEVCSGIIARVVSAVNGAMSVALET